MTNDFPPPPPPQYSAPGAQPLSASDDKLWGSLANFGNIVGFLPALLIFLILKDRGPVVRRESATALNWIIAATIAYIVLIIVGIIFNVLYTVTPSGVDVIFSLLGILVTLLQVALAIVNLIFAILNGVRVNQGGTARYPLTLHLIK